MLCYLRNIYISLFFRFQGVLPTAYQRRRLPVKDSSPSETFHLCGSDISAPSTSTLVPTVTGSEGEVTHISTYLSCLIHFKSSSFLTQVMVAMTLMYRPLQVSFLTFLVWRLKPGILVRILLRY